MKRPRTIGFVIAVLAAGFWRPPQLWAQGHTLGPSCAARTLEELRRLPQVASARTRVRSLEPSGVALGSPALTRAMRQQRVQPQLERSFQPRMTATSSRQQIRQALRMTISSRVRTAVTSSQHGLLSSSGTGLSARLRSDAGSCHQERSL